MMLGSEEECHSNESGWTMYIGSPRDEDDTYCDGDDDEKNGDSFDYDYEGGQADPDVESDDSMTSDASSGPSHHYGMTNPLRSRSGFDDGFTHFQQKEEVDNYCSDHKREARNKSKGNQLVEKNENVFINGEEGKDPVVQNDSKVKVNKNHRGGTGK